jgi:hypothetical protein
MAVHGTAVLAILLMFITFAMVTLVPSIPSICLAKIDNFAIYLTGNLSSGIAWIPLLVLAILKLTTFVGLPYLIHRLLVDAFGVTLTWVSPVMIQALEITDSDEFIGIILGTFTLFDPVIFFGTWFVQLYCGCQVTLTGAMTSLCYWSALCIVAIVAAGLVAAFVRWMHPVAVTQVPQPPRTSCTEQEKLHIENNTAVNAMMCKMVLKLVLKEVETATGGQGRAVLSVDEIRRLLCTMKRKLDDGFTQASEEVRPISELLPNARFSFRFQNDGVTGGARV